MAQHRITTVQVARSVILIAAGMIRIAAMRTMPTITMVRFSSMASGSTNHFVGESLAATANSSGAEAGVQVPVGAAADSGTDVADTNEANELAHCAVFAGRALSAAKWHRVWA